MQNKLLFSYLIASKKQNSVSFLENKIQIGTYHIYISKATKYEIIENSSYTCLIIGLAAPLNNPELSIGEYIERRGISCIDDLINLEFYIGGKYIICLYTLGKFNILGDATSSIPIYYCKNGNGDEMISSSKMLLADICSYNPDIDLMAVRDDANQSRTMPYDYTIFKKIKVLLPNHYLDVVANRSCRFVNNKTALPQVSSVEAAELTSKHISRLYTFYSSVIKLACPITSGRDSRVVLAFLLKDTDVPCYTMKHNEFNDHNEDIIVPKQLADRYNLNYKIIGDKEPSPDQIKLANALIGENDFSKRTLMIANTIHSEFSDFAIINGDIVGQIGKCSLHRNIPDTFATPRYFRCKLHNYSSFSLKAINEWIDEIKFSGEQMNLFDLFSVESRMGRWASDENEVYNLIGQYYLNIFNSRCIINTWTRVPREQRMNSSIHKELIKIINPVLLEIPFERGGLMERVAKSNSFNYLVSSYLKFYIQKIKTSVSNKR